MKKIFTENSVCLLIVFALSFSKAWSQTNPAPFNLSSGNYSFTEWDAASAAGTYPPNGIFHVNTQEDPLLTEEPSSDWICLYNITSRSRIIGEGVNGVSFLNTSDIQDNQTRCGNGPSDIGGYVGAFTIALNATGRNNISVSWLNELLLQSNGAPTPRDYRVRLQYRVGVAATWADVPGTAEFSSAGLVGGGLFGYGPVVLPGDCNNQPVVQLRWKYYEHAANDGGTRPRVRLDEITVTSDIATGIEQAQNADYFSVYPNPSDEFVNFSELIAGSLFSSSGQLVKTFSSTQTLSLEGIKPGVYFIQTLDGSTTKLFKK